MIFNQLQGLLMTMRLWDLLDILVVAFFLYRIYLLIRNTRATALVKGLVVLGVLTLISGWVQLHAVAWILEKLMTVLIVALPVVFQPELRRALEQIGRGKFYVSSSVVSDSDLTAVINSVAEAAETMSKSPVQSGVLLFPLMSSDCPLVLMRMRMSEIFRMRRQISSISARRSVGSPYPQNTSSEK